MNDVTPNTSEDLAPTPREDAQAAVEFALVLPILALILFAALEFGTAFWHYQQLSASASEGARRAAVSRTSSSRSSDIETAVRNAAPGLDSSTLSISTSSTWDPGDPVTVTVSYPENITVMGRTFFSANLVSRRTARVEH